jgi:hypothetical protein
MDMDFTEDYFRLHYTIPGLTMPPTISRIVFGRRLPFPVSMPVFNPEPQFLTQLAGERLRVAQELSGRLCFPLDLILDEAIDDPLAGNF